MNHLLDICKYHLYSLAMAVGPVLGYVHQYYIIQRSKSVGTFSIDICGILLFANILRLNFYIFEKYQLALFFQSLIMIFAQVPFLSLRFVWFIFAQSIDIKIMRSSPNLLLSQVLILERVKIWTIFGDGTSFRPIVRFFLSSPLYHLFHIYHFQRDHCVLPALNEPIWSHDRFGSIAF